MWKPAMLLALAAAVNAQVFGGGKGKGVGNQFHMVGAAAAVPGGGYANSTFKQLLDHTDPSKGTFSQFYYYDTTYWKPGGPVILFTPGEINATRYYTYLSISTNRTTGVIAEKIGAATIVIEHRYWGTSSPYSVLSTENMQYLTLENALADMTYFANNVKLPFAGKNKSNAKDVPWVFVGGSYSGAMSAWLASVRPKTFWAYYASSAVVEAISDFWGYFTPVQEGMPKNCSSDVTLVIDHMDSVLMNGTAQQVHNLKSMFMMESVTHNSDFMYALENGPYLWQSNQFYENGGFFDWCDYVENSYNKTGTAVAGPKGVGLQKALAGYAEWWKTTQLPGYCESYGYADFQGTYNTKCFNMYNASSPLFTDMTLSNVIDRQWNWMLCNQPFGYWQTGAPANRPTIVSRYITPQYFIDQCSLLFPKGPNGQTFGIAKGRTEAQVNAYTKGWNIDNTTRLIYVNGGYDPWRQSTVSSTVRPGGALQSTKQVPVEVVPGGYHTSDLITENGQVNAGCAAVQKTAVNQIAAWVAEFPKAGGYGYN